ncbi:MAG TPA: hypothetical protein VE843_05835, partial [Ktedonobacteraceae bacterium]|nr:hypothetical protein [Ktedonobacteraceae bacterium]
ELALLEQKYIVRDKTEIRQFLRDRLYLVQLLLDTHREIKAYFPNSEVVLDMSIEPEEADDKENLIGSIATDLPSDEAIETLENSMIIGGGKPLKRLMGGPLLAWVDKFLVLYFRQSRNGNVPLGTFEGTKRHCNIPHFP